jgi:hypothetical protein
MSTVTFRHENNYSYKKGGVKHVIKEEIIDGEKGLSFHYLKKSGEDKFHSITVRQSGTEDNYSVRQKVGDKSSDSNMTLADLSKMIKSMKELKFVAEYLPERGTYNGKRKSSKKGKKSWLMEDQEGGKRRR